MADTSSTEPAVEYRGTGFYISLVVIGLLVVALLALAVQNTESVRFEFLWWDLDFPLFALLIATALFTVVLDELVGLAWRRRRRRHLADKQELDRLRKAAAGQVGSDDTTPPVVSSTTDEDDSTDPPISE